MSNVSNKLDFIISLIDRVSGPMDKIMKAQAGFQKGFTQIGVGAAGMAGAAYSMNRLLEPTKEMQKALGEVRSLGVAEDSLKKLQDTALQFSTQYGVSASDFVRSSYDIKSAIDSITGDELPAFTRAGAILAKSSKAQVSDMTSYMGTMYSIFQTTADKMGKTAWIEQMTGQTALAVKIFKSEGKDVSDFFTRIGATATAARRPLEEQMAVFGQLKATMPGAEAGTVYASFLKNVVQAQDILGPLTDSKGQMLPMLDILERIKKTYGDFIDINEAGDLGGKHGFGSEEAVKLINLLLPKMNELQKNTALLGQVQGMKDAERMAEIISSADPFGKIGAGIQAVGISIGTEFLPTLLPALFYIQDLTKSMIDWIHKNSEVAKWIGIVTAGAFGLLGVVGLLGFAVGWATVVKTGWGVAMDLLLKPMWKMVTAI